jgi:hypothetical protein
MLKNTVAVAVVFAALAGPALASDHGRHERADSAHGRYESVSDRGRCTARAAAEWLSVDQITQKLKDQGYTVRKVERSRGCYEVKATDSKGVQVEMYLDPATADVVSRRGRS